MRNIIRRKRYRNLLNSRQIEYRRNIKEELYKHVVLRILGDKVRERNSEKTRKGYGDIVKGTELPQVKRRCWKGQSFLSA